jgi:calcineurin-like phosphoesterase family protein
MQKFNNSNIYFSADFHFNHRNICRGTTRWVIEDRNELEASTRDFQALDEMDHAIVTNINNTVGENDTLFFLGDWSFGGIENVTRLSQLINCRNIHCILGNHDHHIERNNGNTQNRFISVSHYKHIEITHGGRKIEMVLSHYPIASWDNLRKGSFHLYGHLHRKNENRFGPGKMMDVGIDGHPEFRPYHLDEIIDLLDPRPMLSLYNDFG